MYPFHRLLATLAIGLEIVFGSTRICHALMGNSTYKSCGTEEQAFLDKAMFHGRVVALSQAFAECIAEKLVNYFPCAEDPDIVQNASYNARVAIMLQAVRSPNNVDATCKPQNFCGGGRACTYPGFYSIPWNEEEYYYWDTNLLDDLIAKRVRTECPTEDARYIHAGSQIHTEHCRDPSEPYDDAVGSVWHEAMHRHGFNHHANPVGGTCTWPPDVPISHLFFDVPNVAGQCMRDVMWMSSYRCGWGPAATCGQRGQLLTDHFKSFTCACVEERNPMHEQIMTVLGIEEGNLRPARIMAVIGVLH
jgi:hypothetical protein